MELLEQKGVHMIKEKKGIKFKTLIKFKDGSYMYHRDHIEAFNNAKSKGLKNPEDYMYMYSRDDTDYFKNINFRNYISFNQEE